MNPQKAKSRSGRSRLLLRAMLAATIGFLVAVFVHTQTFRNRSNYTPLEHHFGNIDISALVCDCEKDSSLTPTEAELRLPRFRKFVQNAVRLARNALADTNAPCYVFIAESSFVRGWPFRSVPWCANMVVADYKDGPGTAPTVDLVLDEKGLAQIKMGAFVLNGLLYAFAVFVSMLAFGRLRHRRRALRRGFPVQLVE